MQRSRAAADEAALLLAGLALRELQPGGDSPGRGRRGPRPGPGDEAALALGRRGKGGAGVPEAGTDGLSRGERGPRRAAAPELSAPPAGSPRVSLAGSDGGGGGGSSARSSGISLGYDQRHGSPRSGRSDPRPGPGPPSVGSARSSVSSLGSRGSAGAYADLLLPGAGPATTRSPEPVGPAPFSLPSLQLPPGREGGPSAVERRLEALTRELERALEARTARDYFGERVGMGCAGAGGWARGRGGSAVCEGGPPPSPLGLPPGERVLGKRMEAFILMETFYRGRKSRGKRQSEPFPDRFFLTLGTCLCASCSMLCDPGRPKWWCDPARPVCLLAPSNVGVDRSSGVGTTGSRLI